MRASSKKELEDVGRRVLKNLFGHLWGQEVVGMAI